LSEFKKKVEQELNWSLLEYTSKYFY